jgi:protein-disulfide isomerase
MENQSNSKSGTPLLIIGAVFLIVLIVGWFVYSSSKAKPTVTSSNTNSSAAVNATNNYASGSPGAQPAHILGSQTATVTVEEFADFQCTACGAKHPELKQIASIYNNRIKFIFRNFPLAMHPKAYDAAVASEAAGLQGKFWEMQNLLFSKQAEWSASTDHRTLFSDYAQQIGLNVSKFETDALGLPAKQRVDLDMARGRSILVTSTPSVYVNGIPVPFQSMTVDGMRQIIDSELAKSARPEATQNAAETAPLSANKSAEANKK